MILVFKFRFGTTKSTYNGNVFNFVQNKLNLYLVLSLKQRQGNVERFLAKELEKYTYPKLLISISKPLKTIQVQRIGLQGIFIFKHIGKPYFIVFLSGS